MWIWPGRNMRPVNISLSWLKSTIRWLMLSLALAFRERRKAGAIVTLQTKRRTERDKHRVETSTVHYSTKSEKETLTHKQVILVQLTKKRPLATLLLLQLSSSSILVNPCAQVTLGACAAHVVLLIYRIWRTSVVHTERVCSCYGRF